MKKAISLLLAIVMMLTLCACDGQSSSTSKQAQKHPSYGLYIKDSELFFTDLKNEAWQISSRFVDDGDIEDEDLAIYGYGLAAYTKVSSDGSLIFFPDKIEEKDDGCNLYYRRTDDSNAEATKIDSDVTIYSVTPSASVVTYIKGAGEDRNLYQYSIKNDEKEKIASSVSDHYVSEDGSKILYMNVDGNLYFKSSGDEKEKIASDITSIVYHTEDFTTVYYIKDEALYKHPIGADREKIDSDISKVIQVYESGEVYYLKKDLEAQTLMDFVVDDMEKTDADAPSKAPSKPRSYNYYTTEEYEKAYAKYEQDYEAYYAKESRDEVRAYLPEAPLSHSVYSLYYYNGSEKNIITEAFADGIDAVAATEKPVISYVAYNQKDFNKLKLSQITTYDDIVNFTEKVETALFSSSDRYVTIGDTASVVEQENATALRINESGTTVYFIDDIPEGKNAGDLYSVSVIDNTVGNPEVYDSDVYSGACFFLSDEQFLYFKDYKDGNGDLYLNKAKVDYDVNFSNLSYNSESGKIYYVTDWDSEKSYGTLKEYVNGEPAKIADDVYAYVYTPDGKVMYLYDYSLKYYAGELYLWDNGESKKIDDDVIFLMPAFYNGEYVQRTLANYNSKIGYPIAEAEAAEAPAGW